MAKLALQNVTKLPEADDERLLRLFWNRAELKKEFATLRREGDRLKEQLQQQEGAMLRSQQRLEHLEGILADPLQAANASVFYQLRGVWHQCRRKLNRLAKDLHEHQKEREQSRESKLFDHRYQAAYKVIHEKLVDAQDKLNTIIAEQRALQEQHRQLRGFWHYFKRRGLLVGIESQEELKRTAANKVEHLSAQVREKKSEARPEFPGLSLGGKRKINLALIAIAQELYLHFSSRKISILAREATVRQVGDVAYGGVEECRELNAQISRCQRTLPAGEKLVSKIRERAVYLESKASYRRESDTVPVAGSFNQIPLEFVNTDRLHAKKSVPINVLADEFWEIYPVLLT
jgi:hypothetical protein